MITAEQVVLADYTTLHLGGPAARFVRAGTEEEIVAAIRAADAEAEPVLVLGGGSNLVVADQGFPGVVVQLATAGVEVARADVGTAEVTVAAGHDWDEFVLSCIDAGLSGVECLSGIPGRAGATPIQNVNAYGQDVAHTITAVRVYDRLTDQITVLPAAECGFGYRTSVFKRQAAGAGRGAELNPAAATGRFVVLAVTFALTASPQSAPVRYGELSRVLGVPDGGTAPLAEARAAVLSLRQGKGMLLDPADADTRSAGSFFTNPVVGQASYARLAAQAAADGREIPHWPADGNQVKLSAGWLIEQAGFGKGFRLPADPDGARISRKHALALTNPGQGSTASLLRLARAIQTGVKTDFGVELTAEPVLVGVAL